MGFGELFILAIGVSMDAFAVSICKGLATKKAGLRQMGACGLWFGGFQALMPLIGFFLGTLFAAAIEAFDHWVAFALLAFIGGNMLKEALEKNECECLKRISIPHYIKKKLKTCPTIFVYTVDFLL